MKRGAAVAGLIVVVVVLALGSLRAQESREADRNSRLVGTWRLLSTKYGDDTRFTTLTKDEVELKLITPTHFTWVSYDNKTKQITAAAGGHFILVGTFYKETVEYVLGDAYLPLVGKDQLFTCKIEGNRWTHKGTLTSGLRIEEIWERIK